MVSFFRFFFLSFLLAGCTSIIYQPDKYLHAHPEQYNVKFEPFTIQSGDGTKLSAWKLFAKTKPKNLILFFHGNAQNLTSHWVTLHWLTQHATDIIIFDYRGYGLSEGNPDPKGVSEDGLAFLDYAHSEFKKGGYQKFIVYTQSLGGAVALRSLEDFKHREDVALLVLDSTFLSPRLVARDKTNFLFSYFISNNYTADPKLAHITMPVVSIHSLKDSVISYQLGKDLFDSIPSKQKEFWTVNEGGHGNVYFVEKQKFRGELLRVLDN